MNSPRTINDMSTLAIQTLSQELFGLDRPPTPNDMRDPERGPILMRKLAALTNKQINAAPDDLHPELRDLRTAAIGWVRAHEARLAAEAEIEERRTVQRRALLKTACTATGVAALLLALSIAFGDSGWTPALWFAVLAVFIVEALSIADVGIPTEDR